MEPRLLPPRRSTTRAVPARWGAVLVAALALTFGAAPAMAQTPNAAEATPIAASYVPEHAPDPVAWTQLGPDGVLIARALAPAACPSITIDGVETAMAERAGPTAEFPGVVCEAAIPPGVGHAAVGGQPVPLLPDDVARIAVLGDTGCRVEDEWAQDCHDPNAWPFARVADQIAASHPDLIIHVGDYIYRESPCPAGNAGCAGDPWGDNAATWEADFFAPMAPALRAAPLLLVRGNHETCSRAGNGWFRYLDPRPFPAACQDFTEPYAAPVGDLRFLVSDTAASADVKTTPELNEAFAAEIEKLAALAEPGDWLATHKPIAGGILQLGAAGKPDADAKETAVFNATFEALAAAGHALPADIDVILAGHIHLAEAILFDDEAHRPTQIIAGNSGTLEDPGDPGAYTGAFLGNESIDLGLVAVGFGWMTMDVAPDRVTATASALDGEPFFTLVLPAPRGVAGPTP
jgi:predicted phosphodiesterase